MGGDILSVINPGDHASSDRHAFAAKRVTDDVHLLLQAGAEGEEEAEAEEEEEEEEEEEAPA